MQSTSASFAVGLNCPVSIELIVLQRFPGISFWPLRTVDGTAGLKTGLPHHTAAPSCQIRPKGLLQTPADSFVPLTSLHHFLYKQCNRNTAWKERCKRACPEHQVSRRRRKTPFPSEDGIQQISAPNRAVHGGNNQAKQNHRFPAAALCFYPFYKTNRFFLHDAIVLSLIYSGIMSL